VSVYFDSEQRICRLTLITLQVRLTTAAFSWLWRVDIRWCWKWQNLLDM